MKHFFLASLCLAFLSGCNTLGGIGRDMQSFGSGMSDTASNARSQINEMETEVMGAPEEAAPVAQESAAPAQPAAETADADGSFVRFRNY